jgi:hypothetical protein
VCTISGSGGMRPHADTHCRHQSCGLRLSAKPNVERRNEADLKQERSVSNSRVFTVCYDAKRRLVMLLQVSPRNLPEFLFTIVLNVLSHNINFKPVARSSDSDRLQQVVNLRSAVVDSSSVVVTGLASVARNSPAQNDAESAENLQRNRNPGCPRRRGCFQSYRRAGVGLLRLANSDHQSVERDRLRFESGDGIQTFSSLCVPSR